MSFSPLYCLHQPHLVFNRQVNKFSTKLILILSSIKSIYKTPPPALRNSLDKGEMFRKHHRKELVVNFNLQFFTIRSHSRTHLRLELQICFPLNKELRRQ